MSKPLITNIITQLAILAFALQQNWDPYLLFFVYVGELIISTIIGVCNGVRFGGIKYLFIGTFTGAVISGLALSLIYVSANILKPFDIDIANNFISILLTSVSLTWLALLTNSVNIFITETKRHDDIDPFFYPIKSLTRLIPLVFVIIFGGFITLFGFPKAIIVGMTISHIIVDILLSSIPKNTK